MAENDLLVGEVSDELRRDNFLNFVKNIKWILVGLVVVVISFVAYADYAKNQTFADGIAQTSAIELANSGDAGAKAGLLALKHKSALSELSLGKIYEIEGDSKAALAVYQSVAANVNYSSTEQDLAKLRLYAMDPKSAGEELFNPNSPFLTEAKLIKADHLIKVGDKAGAIAIVSDLIKTGASDGMTPMLEQLLLAWDAPIPEKAEPVEIVEPKANSEVKPNAQ